ncbi:hypothetical protein VPH35_013915 [Triticum aestivum]
MGSVDLVLKPACEGCGSTSDLYGTGCKHTTLCSSCGKSMALSRARCLVCSAPITNLIREYNVRANASTDKAFSIGRFVTGLPPFSKKKNAENKWSLHKEGLQGRQLTDKMLEKYNRKPWILEDETGQYQFQGHMEGSQSATATYYLLMLHGKEFHAFPAGSWYNFSKVAQYKQLTLEEAEEKMNKRKTSATGYERWMMKAATNGPAAFGSDMMKLEPANDGEKESARHKKGKDNEEGNNSDKGEENEEEEAARKDRLGLSKRGMDDDEEGGKDLDFDLDDDIEKGDDWEHEETFTDDDEAVDIDPEERADLAPEIPAPPEIKQDDEENEEEGGLSKSGKELKKLLGRSSGQNESDADDDDEEDDVILHSQRFNIYFSLLIRIFFFPYFSRMMSHLQCLLQSRRINQKMNLLITAQPNLHLHQDMLVVHLLHRNPSKRGNQVVMMPKHLAVQLQRKQRWNLIQKHQVSKRRHHLPQNLHQRPLLHQEVPMYLL